MNVGVVDIDVCISSHFKEELAWAVDKRLQVISTSIMLFKNRKVTKELKGNSRFKLKTTLYMLLCGP